jgi:[ribosomal protein S5]-alanine N-acetyltransferase
LSPRAIEFPVGGITDGVVRLRLPSDADVPRIVEACRDPDVSRYTTVPNPYQPAHTVEWMQRGLAGLASGTDLQTVIAEADDSDVLGTIGLHDINRVASRCVAGYLTAPWARRRGVAGRALYLLCGYAFRDLHLARVEVTIEPENSPSRATAESVGFREEGLLRSYMSVAGARRDMLMYSVLPGDLRPPAGDRDADATLEG